MMDKVLLSIPDGHGAMTWGYFFRPKNDKGRLLICFFDMG